MTMGVEVMSAYPLIVGEKMTNLARVDARAQPSASASRHRVVPAEAS